MAKLLALGGPLAEERLVGGVLQQAAHQVGHARDQLADRGVDPDPLAQQAQGGVDRPGHPVEHLQLDRAVGQPGGPGGGQAVGQATEVVTGEGRPDRAGAVDQVADAALVVGVGLGLLLEDRHRPALGLGDDGLVVPVGAFDQPDLERQPQRRLRPGHEVAQVGVGVLPVGLDDAAQLGPAGELVAQRPDELEGEVLHVVVLGVDVDGGRDLPGPQQQRPQPGPGLLQALGPGQRPEPGCQGGGLDRDVDPGHQAPGVLLEDGLGRPCGRRPGEALEHLADPGGVPVGFGRGEGLLAEEVDGRRLAEPPQLLQGRQGLGRRLAGDELAGHAVDVAPGGGGRDAGPERQAVPDVEP